MSKYIVEIKPEYEDSFKGLIVLGAKDSNLFVDALAVEDIEELNSDYINEHFGDLQDEAYQKGFNDGKEYGLDESDMREAVSYQRGLDDAWEAAKKIALNPGEGGLRGEELHKMFDCYTLQQVFRKCSVQQAIAKLKAYEEKQKADDEIKVGDEVIDKDGDKTIVTYIHGELFDGLCHDGSAMSDMFLEYVDRTGRHFDIDKILGEMRE